MARRPDGKVLVAQRPLGKRHAGLWEFPGGKLELGESHADAARRELMEELAVDVVQIGASLDRVADPGSPFVITYVEVQLQGDPSALEHQAVAWADPTELLDWPLAPADARFVRRLLGEPDTPTGA